MIEIEDVPPLRSPVLIAAFEGWNDAADAASGVLDHLLEVWDSTLVAVIDPEDFYDFQMNRPSSGTDEHGHAPDHLALDPAVGRLAARVRSATSSCCAASSPTCAGASSAPSCSPRPTSSGPRWSSRWARCSPTPRTPGRSPCPARRTEPELADRLKLEQSTYEGPTGIVGVFQDACVRTDMPAVSFWAAVPHYVAQPPCPKATLALLGQLEDLLEVSIPLGDLPEDARAWERGVDELAEEDEEIGDYVRALEETRDTADLPEASGEAIAREFERYLKRRENPDGLIAAR